MTTLIAGAALAIEAAPVMGFIDPSWALPANTLLLILLSIMQAHERHQLNRVRRDVQLTRKDVRDAKRKVGANRRETPTPDTGERRRFTDQPKGED